MEFASNPALKVFIGSPSNAIYSTVWNQIQGFVRQFGPEAAENLAKQLGSSGAAAVRHAISTFESVGPSPWTMKAAENVSLSPREFGTLHSMVRALTTARAAASNPDVQKTVVGTGATATAAGGLVGTVSAVFGAESLGAIGAMGGAAVTVAGACVLAAGAAGYGLGTLIDHAVGWVRDDGRGLTDLVSGANQGVPVQDPTGYSAEGWRFIADKK